MVKVKICGITNEADALEAVRQGADALGFVFYKASPRYVNPSVVRQIISALPPFVTPVGVFVNEEIEKVQNVISFCRLSAVQLQGEEPPFYCEKIDSKIIKAIRVKSLASLENLKDYKKVDAFLLDTFDEEKPGGTGKPLNLNFALKAKSAGVALIIAGGLNKSNVAKIIRQLKPYGIDVSSSIEARPGRKDWEKLAEFMARVRSVKRQTL